MRTIKDIFENDPALAGEMVDELQRAGTPPVDDKEKLMLTTLVKLYGGTNRRFVNYYGPPHTVTTIPYYRALQLDEINKSGQPVDLKGKAVFVGLSEKILAERKDSFYTVFSQANGVFIGGVEIAATAFLNLLEDKPSNRSAIMHICSGFYFGACSSGIICRVFSLTVGGLALVGSERALPFGAQYRFTTDGTCIQSSSLCSSRVLWHLSALFCGITWKPTRSASRSAGRSLTTYPTTLWTSSLRTWLISKTAARWFTVLVYSPTLRATPPYRRR